MTGRSGRDKQEHLTEKLKGLSECGAYPFHMPGHKRNAAMLGTELPYGIDITEIAGFDNLHQPEGVLRELNQRLAELYESEHSFALVNGSTCGLLAAMGTVLGGCTLGQSKDIRAKRKVITARNCHKAVYHGLALFQAEPVFLYPEIDEETGFYGSLQPCQVEEALKKNPDAALVICTSPTYEGVISDIAAIAEVCHRYDVPLLTDGAHGAHLTFFTDPRLHECGLDLMKSDLTVVSLHKTLPAMTQTAALHVNGARISAQRTAEWLAVFETSSPSYVLLASIDRCASLLEEDRENLFAAYEKKLQWFSEQCRSLKYLKVMGKGLDPAEGHWAFYAVDPGKICIYSPEGTISGPEMMEYFRESGKLELEMAGPNHVLAMTSVCDTDKGLQRLWEALKILDQLCGKFTGKKIGGKKEAETEGGEDLLYKECEGRVSAEALWCYPPGIPLLVPGEVISAELIRELQNGEKRGLRIFSSKGNFPKICLAGEESGSRRQAGAKTVSAEVTFQKEI